MRHARMATLILTAAATLLAVSGCPGDPPAARAPQADASVTEDPDMGEPGTVPPDPDAGPEEDAPVVDARPPRPDAPHDPANTQICERLRAGPFAPVMGTDIFNMDAPSIASDQQVYRVTIPRRAAGHVTFSAPTVGEYAFFTSTAAPLNVFAIDGELVLERNLSTKIPECTEVKGRVAFRLPAAKHVVRLGPEASGSVDVIVTFVAP